MRKNLSDNYPEFRQGPSRMFVRPDLARKIKKKKTSSEMGARMSRSGPPAEGGYKHAYTHLRDECMLQSGSIP